MIKLRVIHRSDVTIDEARQALDDIVGALSMDQGLERAVIINSSIAVLAECVEELREYRGEIGAHERMMDDRSARKD